MSSGFDACIGDPLGGKQLCIILYSVCFVSCKVVCYYCAVVVGSLCVISFLNSVSNNHLTNLYFIR